MQLFFVNDVHAHTQAMCCYVALLSFYFLVSGEYESTVRTSNAVVLLFGKVVLCRVLIWMT